MQWLETAQTLTETKKAFVIVSIAQVRGHAPRSAGSKMLVTEQEVFGSVGGGNLEQTAIEKARALLCQTSPSPELFTVTLNPEGGDWGVQCCGGEVTLLLEPINPTRATVAIFGAGHVGWALVQVLSILPIDVKLIDSRAGQLEPPESFNPQPEIPRSSGQAFNLQLTHSPIPETALETISVGAHLLVMTHDHAEDIAILDTALKRDGLGFIGLIGSSAKWAHFQSELKKQGHTEAALKRVTTPIGLPGVQGKSPQVIAIATAAQLLQHLDLPEDQF